ncbi:MAG: shikimate dehydrogenase [Hyphomicrobiales bacterium]|nr:MAG: shikimate dehydrogenase [Hyphomicrobiales bacterium]
MAEAAAPRAFVVGHPIAHSRSPLIHGFWLETLGIAGSYERLDVHPDAIDAFLRGLPRSGFVGGNVTIPHKQAAHRAADRLDAAAEAIGAANTLWLEDGRLVAGNTDAHGFAASLDSQAPGWRQARTALVLGAGGAARAVVFALKEAGFADIRLVNRTLARAQELADRFGPGVSAHGWDAAGELSADAGLVVNTSSLGMAGKDALPLDVSLLPGDAIVADIVYVPLETPLLAAARARGLVGVDGLGMLLHQAVPGFERWFGARPQVTPALRERIVADLEKDA